MQVDILEKHVETDCVGPLQSLQQNLLRHKSESNQRMDELESKIKDLQSHMINKVDCDFFDEEIHTIKGMMSTL